MIRQSAYSLLSLLVMGVGKALFVLLTANFYGPAGQGVVTLGISVMVAGALFLGLGTDLAGTYLVGRDPSSLPALRTNSAVLSLLSFVVAWGVVSLALRYFGDTIFRDFPANGVPALVVLVGLQIFHQQIQGLTVGVGRFGDLAVGNSLQYLLLVVGMVILHLRGEPVAMVLYLWAGGLTIKIIYLLLRLPSIDQTGTVGGLEILRRQLTVGPQMMMGNLTNLLNFRLDAYFIAYYLPASSLGIYAVASTIAEGALYLPKAFGQVVFSWSSQARDDRRELGERIRSVFLTAAWSTLLFVLALQVLLQPLLVILFGESFLPALTPGRLLLVASVAYGVGLVAMNWIYGFGNPNWNTKAGAIAVVLNAAGNVFAIPRWGITGAAFVSLLSYSVYCLLNLANVARYLPQGASLASLLIPDRKYVSEAALRTRQVWKRLQGWV